MNWCGKSLCCRSLFRETESELLIDVSDAELIQIKMRKWSENSQPLPARQRVTIELQMS